jgi:putative tricarboxylic transport membrane protein
VNKRDVISCVVWLCISIFVFIASLRLGIGAFHSPGPGFIPFWSSIMLALFTCILLGISLFKKKEAVRPADVWKGLRWGSTIIVVAALIFYCLALPNIGYILATFGLMIVLFSLGKMKPWVVILGSLLTVVLSYSLFDYFLKMPLPRGIFGF